MKKIFTFIFVLLGVSMAQAVTINWTANLKDGTGAAAGISGMAILTTHVDTTTHDKLWKIISWSSDKENTDYTANTGNGYAFVEQVKMNGTSVYTTPTLVGGVFSHTTTFDATVGNEIALVFFNKYYQGATVVNVTLEALATDATYDINLGDLPYLHANALSVREVTAAVPEPTVLALLAFGIAGVTLRRKKVVA